jgi:hypothetical protein
VSRSGYDDCPDNDWSLIRWRGQVASAIRGRRGQAFLREMADALDAMPERRLIADEFWNGESCALGVVAVNRGIDVVSIDRDDNDRLAELLGIARQLVMEIEYENDEALYRATPERRWQHMRDWVRDHLKEAV